MNLEKQAERIDYKEIVCVFVCLCDCKEFGFYALGNGEPSKHFKEEIGRVRAAF